VKKAADASRTFWICGVHPVREALRVRLPGAREMLVCREGLKMEGLRQLAAEARIPVRSSTREKLEERSGSINHQGVALLVEGDPYFPLESFLEAPAEDVDPLLILDSVQDPQNLGALLRSGCFLGARGVILPKDRSVGLTAAAVKVSAGAAAHLPLIRVGNLVRAMERVKEKGLWIVGLELENALSLYEVDLSVPAALVLGNEEKGLRPLVRKHCDFLARIPRCGPLQSLNVAAAGAVALAEIQRRKSRRRAAEPP